MGSMTARYIETRDVDPGDLQPYPGNAKLHDERGLLESVETNGQFRSVLARRLPDDTLQLLAGHGTTDAIKDVGGPVRVEVVEADDDEARRIEALLALLDDANTHGGFAGTGYDEDLYKELLDKVGSENPHDWEPDSDPDDVPEVPEEPVTKLGDVWTLGDHRVMAGSALDPADVTRLLNGRKPGIVYADPPYGINIVKAAKVGGGGPAKTALNPTGKDIKASTFKPVIGDETTETASGALALAREQFPKALQVWWGANHYAGSAALADTACWLVWDKQNDGLNFADAELAWTNHGGAVRIFRHMWNGMVRASERGKRVHPNQKPAALAAWALDTLDPDHKQHDVLDLFGGSGSALLGAEQTGRAACLMELDPGYVDVIVRRWEELTGGTPLLNGEPIDMSARDEA